MRYIDRATSLYIFQFISCRVLGSRKSYTSRDSSFANLFILFRTPFAVLLPDEKFTPASKNGSQDYFVTLYMHMYI